MKTFTRFLIALCILLAPAAFGAGNIITATVTLTNTIFGTSNGMTLTLNGDTRTFTNLVQVPANQVLTNLTTTGSTTNLFTQIADFPFTGISLTYAASNAIALKGTPGSVVTAAISVNWATLAYTTNYLTNAYILRLPVSVEQPPQQTNLASMAATMLESSTNSLSATDVLLSNYVSGTQVQLVSGNKAFTGTSNYINAAFLNNPTLTNGVNYFSAFSSPGPFLPSDQFGSGASAAAAHSIAAGAQSLASGDQSSAFGYAAHASGISSTALGAGATSTGTNSIVLGVFGTASASNSMALGVYSTAAYSNSVALGTGSTTTGPAQIMLGAPGVSTIVNNYLSVLGGATFANGITNLLLTGTNALPAGADISFGRFPITTLANGPNAAVPVGTNVFIQVSGPSGAFTINGINGGPNRDGKLVIIENATGQTMTIANNSGGDPTAANRILTGFGADQSYTNNPGMVTLIYNGNAALWIVVSHN